VDNLNLFDLFAKITLDTSDYEQGVEGARDKGNSLADVLKGGLATAGKAAAAGLAAAGTAAVALGKSALDSYAEYEQLVGGVDTLFKDASDKLQGYAANAYQTAGMSANDYMANITSFSAALINSVGGDTEKAADMADRAITDMADNANKMGTSLDSIVQTYQSLSRGNFAMLDNLKLGYGGTKAELERLLEDAEAYKASMGEIADYDVSSFADIVSAIGAIQEKMGIAGATASEAATTIEGSTNSMKAAWANLVTGIAGGNGDIDQLLSNFLSSVEVTAGNVIPVVERIAKNIFSLLEENGPEMVKAGATLLGKLAAGAIQSIPQIVSSIPEIVMAIVDGFMENGPAFVEIGTAIVEGLWNGIASAGKWIKEKVTGFLGGIVDDAKDFLGIHSPSTVFAGIGENMSLGLGAGWEDSFKKVKEEIVNGLDFGAGNIDFAASGLGMSSAGMINAASGSTGGMSLPSVIELRLSSSDGQTFGRWMVPFIRSEDKSNPEVVSDAI